ncbi:glycosyltransferase [Candidatus Magnetomorum sp. HK-1]|nr:glycosyltransferase [Candidatus Magnetomorum sp. HK-1]
MSSQVTIIVPSLNQDRYLYTALRSIFLQEIPVEVIVMDGGSTDQSVRIIKHFEPYLLYWKSAPDGGQSQAINEGIQRGKAPYVCWLNSDDCFLPFGLRRLLNTIHNLAHTPAVYGKCWSINNFGKKIIPYVTTPFWPKLLENYCFIAQPAVIVRRSAWEQIGGLNENLHMAMDYDMWWRLYQTFGKMTYLRKFVACTRFHEHSKTSLRKHDHYTESIETVRLHTGNVPLKWKFFKRIINALN